MMQLLKMWLAGLLMGAMIGTTNLSIAAPSGGSLGRINLAQANAKIFAGNIPRQTLRKVQLDIQKRYKVSLNQINLVGAVPRTWNGCLGLEKPNTACIEIAISGFKVLMTGPNNRFWVYHVDESGSRLALNSTTSLPLRSKIPAPRFVEHTVPTSGDETIFQAAMVTGLVPFYEAIELKSAGVDAYVLTRRRIGPSMGNPQVIKRLGAKQVQPFLDVLNQNSFQHFEGMSYFNNGRVALDAPVWQLSLYGAVTEYTMGDEKDLPPKLRAIVQAWGEMVR